MDTKWISLILRKKDSSIDIDRQLARLEPLALLVLGSQGLIILSFMGGLWWQWAAVAGVLLLGGWGSSRWGQAQTGLIVRAGLTLGLTWLLLLTTGGAGSDFFLWYFILVAIYPMILPTPFDLILLSAVPLAYLLLGPVSSQPVSLFHVLAWSFLLIFLGWLIWSIKATLISYILRRDQSERRLALAVETSGIVLHEFSIPFDDISYSSDQWEAILGYQTAEAPIEPEERVKWLMSLIHPDDAATAVYDYTNFIEGRTSIYQYERRMKHKSGSWIWVSGYAVALERDDRGQPTRVLGMMQDITQRKQADAQLHYQANLLENVSDAIIATDSNFVIQSWNKAAEEMYGLSAAEVIGRLAVDVLTTTYPDDNQDDIVKQFRQNGRWQGELVQYHQDGAPFDVLASSSLLMDPEGQPIGAVSVNRDITDRKQIEEALRRSEQTLQLFVENAPAAIAMFDRDMRYIAASRRYSLDYDLGDQPLIGRSHYEVFPEIPERWREIHCRCLAGAVEKAEADPFLRANGKLDWVRWEIHPWYEPSGDIGGLLLFSEVITERKQLEEQYYQAQKMEAIGHLAGGIAHDFNNILVPIIGYAELGMMQIAPGEQLYTDLDLIRQAAERAANLTRQILAFSRKQILQIHVLDLNPLIADFQKMLRRLIGENIELDTFLAPDLHPVKADKAQLEQVLLNLVINARDAIDAMPEGGSLIIETANVYLDETYVQKHADIQTPGHYAMVAVSDTGHGMDAQTQAQIFEPFFTTKDRGKGTGLGLATVFGIIRQHQGYIWVYSEPNRGTTFKIYLPRAEDAGPTTNPTAPLEPHSLYGTETILVVEDEEMVRKLAVETLEAHGYHVLEAESSRHSLQLATAYPGTIHLLLTDVIMPGLNGRELYHQLLELQPDLRVLYMSGYTDNVIVHHGILYEGINFLQKPFTIRKLLQKVRMVLAKDEG